MICYLIGRTSCKRTSEPVTLSLMRLSYVPIVVLGTLLIALTSYANHRCPTLYVGDRVTVQNIGEQNVGNIGLAVRPIPGGTVAKARVFDGTQGTIRKGPKPWGRHIWYEIEWDDPIGGVGENWSAGLIESDQGDSLQTLRLHREGAEAAAARRNRDKQRREIASKLFKISSNCINYDYNDYACHPENVRGYRGGHSGWDAQTKNVATTSSENMPFYSLTTGRVIRVEEGDPDTLSVIAVHSDDDFNSDGITTLYLHAREIFVEEDQEISVGDRLGIQGNAGLWGLADAGERKVYLDINTNNKLTTDRERKENYREHVHIEVREGETGITADGAGISQLLREHSTIDPIPYLYQSIVENRFPPADVNRDGQVDILDGTLVVENFGKNDPQFDITGDGVIGIADLVEIVKYLHCELVPKGPVHNHSQHAAIGTDLVSDGNMRVSQETVQQWLTILHQTNDGSLTFKEAIALLKTLLYPTLPEQTILFANYPNPFNPETWIPYYLATDADVTITIYDAIGGLVCQLNIGHQRPGYYTTRNRAAYWNGTSETGEPVASGIYYYTLTTGNNSSLTRKMVILK